MMLVLAFFRELWIFLYLGPLNNFLNLSFFMIRKSPAGIYPSSSTNVFFELRLSFRMF